MPPLLREAAKETTHATTRHGSICGSRHNQERPPDMAAYAGVATAKSKASAVAAAKCRKPNMLAFLRWGAVVFSPFVVAVCFLSTNSPIWTRFLPCCCWVRWCHEALGCNVALLGVFQQIPLGAKPETVVVSQSNNVAKATAARRWDDRAKLWITIFLMCLLAVVSVGSLPENSSVDCFARNSEQYRRRRCPSLESYLLRRTMYYLGYRFNGERCW